MNQPLVLVALLIIGCVNALPLQKRDVLVRETDLDHLGIHFSKGEQSNKYKGRSGKFECHLCKVVTWVVQQTLHKEEGTFASVVDRVCKALHVEESDICDGIIKSFKVCDENFHVAL